MRCHICDAELSDKEIQFNRDHGDWDPCGRCLDVIGEVFSHEPEGIIDDQLEFELLTLNNQEDKPDVEESY